jgi:MFS family permease
MSSARSSSQTVNSTLFRLITLLLVSTMTVMAGATISPALPQIEDFFQETPNATFWVKLMLTMPALFTAIAAPFVGVIIDRFGRKPLLVAATILYGAAGGSGLVLNSLNGLLIGRAFLGLSVGAIMTAATALIADYYIGPKREQVMGLQAAFMGYGGVVFLVLGGVLADLGWRFPFAIYLVAFVLCGLVLLFITEPQSVLGARGGGLQSGDSLVGQPQASPMSDGSMRDGEALQGDRTLQSLPNAELAPPTALPSAALALIATIYLLMFASMVAFYLVPVQLPFYLKSLAPVTNAHVGVAIASLTLASALVSMNYRRIKAHFTFGGILVLVYLCMGIGYGIIASARPSDAIAQPYATVLVGLIIAGAGLGLLMPNMNVWLSAMVPPMARGRWLSGLTTALFLGQFFSPIVSQPAIARVGLGATYGWFGLGMGLLAAVILLFLWQTKSYSVS